MTTTPSPSLASCEEKLKFLRAITTKTSKINISLINTKLFYNISDIEKRNNYATSLLIFIIQVSMLCFVMYQLVTSEIKYTEWSRSDKTSEIDSDIRFLNNGKGSVFLNLTRFVCILVLHITQEPEILQSLKMIKIVYLRPDEF